MNEIAITVENVEYAYPGTKALQGLTLEVPVGSVMGLLGPNGAGKSTLIHLLNGFMPPRRGVVEVLGKRPWRERVSVQRETAYVPEHPILYPWMSVEAFLKFYNRVYPNWDSEYVHEKAEAYKLPLRKKCGHLSRGQQGTLSLLVALGRRSRLLLLDDPTLGLDVLSRRRLYRTIVEELAEREVTILFATHLPGEVEGILTHAAFIREGKIVKSGTIEALKAQTMGSAEGSPSLEDLAIAFMEADNVS